jgi:hypothetical protein
MVVQEMQINEQDLAAVLQKKINETVNLQLQVEALSRTLSEKVARIAELEGQISANAAKKRLLALGYRKDLATIEVCVNRLRMGEKPWQLYGEHAPDPIVSQDLGIKVGKDYAEGKLNFLEEFPVDEQKKAESPNGKEMPDAQSRKEKVPLHSEG